MKLALDKRPELPQPNPSLMDLLPITAQTVTDTFLGRQPQATTTRKDRFVRRLNVETGTVPTTNQLSVFLFGWWVSGSETHKTLSACLLLLQLQMHLLCNNSNELQTCAHQMPDQKTDQHLCGN